MPIAQATVPKTLKTKTPVDRAIHSHRLDKIGNSLLPTKKAGHRSQQIIETVTMNQVNLAEERPTEFEQMGIHSQGTVSPEGWEVNDLDILLVGTPSPFKWLNHHFRVPAKTEVSGEYGDFVSAVGEGKSQCGDHGNWSPTFLKREIKLNDFQDVHRHLRILTLAEYSYSV